MDRGRGGMAEIRKKREYFPSNIHMTSHIFGFQIAGS
jgi:hypothetical protein